MFCCLQIPKANNEVFTRSERSFLTPFHVDEFLHKEKRSSKLLSKYESIPNKDLREAGVVVQREMGDMRTDLRWATGQDTKQL